MEVCLGHWERTLSGDEQRLGQNRGKKGSMGPFRGPTGRYGRCCEVGGSVMMSRNSTLHAPAALPMGEKSPTCTG
jgi:hypothetical protein